MALELAWTKRAMQGYNGIVNYLQEGWTEREVRNFIQETSAFFDLLKIYPEILEKTAPHKHVYRLPINRYTYI